MRLTPGPRLIGAALAWLALGLAAALWRELLALWQLAAVGLGAAAFADLMRLRRLSPPQVTRRLDRNLPVAAWSTVTLNVCNTGRQPVDFVLHDLHPPEFEVCGMPLSAMLLPGQDVEIRYQLKPPTRGAFQVPGTDIGLASPWRLWRERRRAGSAQLLRVYPNFAEIANYALLATDNRLSQMGVRRRQRRGEGNDFHQLREYHSGDSLRQIDWKATSRYRKLISREYQDERDQQILFMVDCGRRMHHADAARVHLDEALNAMLLLAYVSVRQGDAVGFMAFGGVRRWFAPRKGAQVVTGLLNATYDLQSTTAVADYRSAAGEVMALQRRRALIVVLTNTRDEDHSDLEAAVRVMRGRHLVVVADLRETLLDELVAHPVHSLDDALRFHATEEYLTRRHESHERLSHHGARVLDITPRQLPVALVNQYFSIKRSGTL